MIPAIVNRISALSLGKQVTVMVSGKKYQLPLVPEPEQIKAPDPIELLSKQLEQRDNNWQAAMQSFTQNVDGALGKVNDAFDSLKVAQYDVAKSIEKVSSVMAAPVMPVYDKQGKLISAQRVIKES